MDFLIATMKHPIKKMMVHHSSQTVVYSPNMTNDMACKFVFSEKNIFIYIPSTLHIFNEFKKKKILIDNIPLIFVEYFKIIQIQVECTVKL
jgi:hypothetical protein